jgi:hypothetical protein
VALAGMHIWGRRGILARALGGIAMSGVILASALSILLLVPRASEREFQRLAGEWEGRIVTPSGTLDSRMSLSPDHRATVRLSAGDQSMSSEGQWGVAMEPSTKKMQLSIKFDAGHDPAMGDGVAWTVDRVEDNQITLVGKGADGSPVAEEYRRIAK